jgi:hypothetical protein
MSSRIRIARLSPIRDVPHPVPGDMAGATGSPDTRRSNSLHTKSLPKRSGAHGKDLSVARPLSTDHELYLSDMNPQSDLER